MATSNSSAIGMYFSQALQKRAFDLFFAACGLLAVWWLILLAWLAASIDTRSNGFYRQKRIGRNGKAFRIIKIKTMRPVLGFETAVTCSDDPRITSLGALIRRTKIDELPQLWNILLGDMSFVGPRPDIPGFADALEGIAKVQRGTL